MIGPHQLPKGFYFEQKPTACIRCSQGEVEQSTILEAPEVVDFSAGLTHAVRSAQPLDFLGGKMSAEIGIMDLNVIRVPKGELKKIVWHFRYRTVGNPGGGNGQFYVRGWSCRYCINYWKDVKYCTKWKILTFSNEFKLIINPKECIERKN